jgi:hypothetical protein
VPRHVTRFVALLVAAPTLRVRVPRHVARLVALLVADYFTSCGSSSTTSPRAGSSSTTLPTPHVRVPRHVARLVAPLVVDYFTYAARLGASARHMARCRLLCLAQLVVNYFTSLRV